MRPLSAKSAYRCEYGIEGRCRCRCKGKFHGTKRKTARRDDPHEAAFYCPCCGAPRRLRYSSEIRYDSRRVRDALRKLDPWRNPTEKTVTHLIPPQEESHKLSTGELRKLLIKVKEG
jgi:hypothetical protein